MKKVAYFETLVPGSEIQVGKPAFVGILTHPNPSIKGPWIQTTPVVHVFDGGFETMNTIYHQAVEVTGND